MRIKLLNLWWKLRLPARKTLCRLYLLNELPIGVGAEVGVFKGEFSNYLIGRATTLYLIDPWKNNNLQYKKVASRFSNFSNVKILRAYSNDVDISEGLDWIYIDGDHTYKGVTDDLTHFYPLIKTNGILCGDDYQQKFPAVIEAVNDFCKVFKLKKTIIGSQFMIRK